MKKVLVFISLFCFINLCSNAQSLIVVTQQETGMYNQTWFYDGSGKSAQEDKIKEYWDEDFYINSVAYTSKGWFVSMAKGLKWTNQSYSYKTSWPDEWIHEKRKAGYMITSLSSSNSNWMVVMSKNTDYQTQEICSAPVCVPNLNAVSTMRSMTTWRLHADCRAGRCHSSPWTRNTSW